MLGHPFDSTRIALFEKLFIELQNQELRDIPDPNKGVKEYRNFAFFEAYFSNYIEGTEFEVEEAMQIIESQMPLPARNEDSHDILGTYNIVSNIQEMKHVPQNPEDLYAILRYRHKILLQARTEKMPGQFKNKNNRAGNTQFVDFTLVRGTLLKGFDYYRNLRHPFARAAYMMFLISEVHPFLDGNGRIARVMMNAELSSAGQSKIIIPTVFREDYMGALRQLTRQGLPQAYIRMLGRARDFSATIAGPSMNQVQQHLKLCDAFKEPEKGKLKIMEMTDKIPDERTRGLRR
jgi:fido (protein-threonine AMPylation protein)